MKKIIEDLANKNQSIAQSIIQESHIVKIWETAGAKINLVGSLAMGLLLKHRDIDFHLYTEELNVEKSFAVMAQICANPQVTYCEFRKSLGYRRGLL